MFFVTVRYVKPLETIDALLAEHVDYLRGLYAAGHLVCSGRQVPRKGGALLFRGIAREALEETLARDPFARGGAAEYDILEFMPSMAADGLSALIEA